MTPVLLQGGACRAKGSSVAPRVGRLTPGKLSGAPNWDIEPVAVVPLGLRVWDSLQLCPAVGRDNILIPVPRTAGSLHSGSTLNELSRLIGVDGGE